MEIVRVAVVIAVSIRRHLRSGRCDVHGFPIPPSVISGGWHPRLEPSAAWRHFSSIAAVCGNWNILDSTVGPTSFFPVISCL